MYTNVFKREATIDTLLAMEMAPFISAIALVAGLVILEIIALLLGGSIFGIEADAPDADFAAEADFSLDDGFDFDADASADAELDQVTGADGAGGILGGLGIGEAPIILWLAGVATSFGVSGFLMQSGLNAVFGAMLPAMAAGLIAVAPGLIGGKYIARMIARLAPKTETTAVSQRHLGGRLGVVVQGTAEAGRPAQARVTDRHGANHYIRVVPRDPNLKIPSGTDVIVFRPKDGIHPVIPFDSE